MKDGARGGAVTMVVGGRDDGGRRWLAGTRERTQRKGAERKGFARSTGAG
ncbi:uncharacterized protein DS421_17g595390 [Arachis hypogaea]|nr:uncharacterized protein DS421_17g595390 [Arachis hypogaea]